MSAPESPADAPRAAGAYIPGQNEIAAVLARLTAAQGRFSWEEANAMVAECACDAPIFADEKSEEDFVYALTGDVGRAVLLVGRMSQGGYPRIEPRFYIEGPRVRWLCWVIKPLWLKYDRDDDSKWFEVTNAEGNDPAVALVLALFHRLARLRAS